MIKFKENSRTVVLTGGGTAGHVMPHIALLPHLRNDFDRICYIGSFEGIEKSLMAEFSFVEYYAVTTVKLRRSLDLRNLTIPFKLVKGVCDAKRLLKQLRPSVVFSKGGFVAYPVVRAAAGLKIPIVAHESDMSMGLANRLSAKYCKIICTTFAQTAAENLKCIHTGAPIREEVYRGVGAMIEKRHFHGASAGRKNLLVVGGSLGAVRVNNAVRGALTELLKDFNIVHIAGKGKVDNGILVQGYVQLEFVKDIKNYYAWADVVVSRAGSNAMCELLALGKRVLFIPLSKAQSRGDQIENAKWVLQQKLGEVLFEEDVTQTTLIEKTKDASNAIFTVLNSFEIDGTEKVASIIRETSQK